MPDTPHDSDDTDESNDTDGESSEIVIDDGEVAAEFLEDRSPEEYPAVLQITSESSETHRREALDRLERWEAGEEVPHVVNFENPSDVRKLLTDRRVELLRSVMTQQPESIRRLAERLDRDVKSVARSSRSTGVVQPCTACA
jgi:predicted transcriptional regulator